MEKTKSRYSSVYRVRPKKRRASYASVLGGDLRRTCHEPATDDEPMDDTSDETSPETSDATSGEREEDGDDSDDSDDTVWSDPATSGAAAAAAGRGCALVGDVYLPAFCGDQMTHPVDFLVDIETWLVSRQVVFESWVDVAIERMFGLPRLWAIMRYASWVNWGAFRCAFLARFWNETAKMELVDQFFASKYCRKEFGSTVNYALFWLNKVKHLLLEKTNEGYSLDR